MSDNGYEYRRLAALRAYEILDTPPDPVLDQIAELAASVFDTAISCVSLVDSSRLFLKAAHGVDTRELGAEPGMCVTTVETNEPRQVPDLLLDEIAKTHPLVQHEPNLRFYAGTPLRSRDGHAIGTLCVLDRRPRQLDEMQMHCLAVMGDLVIERLENHRQEAERAAQARAVDRYGPFVRLGASLSPVGVLDLDVDGFVVKVNGSARAATHLDVGDHLVDMAVADEQDRTRLADLWERRETLATQGDTMGLGLSGAGGTTVLLQAEAQLRDDKVEGYIATTRELDGLADLGDRMLQAQKLESLGALAGGIAHDFNNVLAAVMGYSGLARESAGNDPATARHLDNIDTATERARNLCDQLLAYAGGGQFTVSRFDLADLVSDTTDLLKVSVSKKLSLQVTAASGPTTMEGNETQIRQVVMNMLLNAAEAIGDARGTIAVRTSTRHVSDRELATMYFGDTLVGGEYVCLEVADDGEGMDAETVPRIFDPLFSTKHTGHGLGMAAVGGIMRVHRSAIDVSTSPDRGTRMRVYFPAAGARRVETSRMSPAAEASSGHGTVLVVEDEPALRDVLDEVLTAAGFETRLAADGAEAIELLDQPDTPFVAAVIDMMLPLVDGADVFDHLSRVHPDVRVVLTSGYNEREATRRITETGRAQFAKKPFRPDDLVRMLKELV